MLFVAIMDTTSDGRLAKRADFLTEVEADAHVVDHIARWPDAFVIEIPVEPEGHWLIDMSAKTVVIVPPPPPDFIAIDQATVDRMLLESGVMRALALMIFEVGKAGKTGNWAFFDDVIDEATYKTLFMSMIR